MAAEGSSRTQVPSSFTQDVERLGCLCRLHQLCHPSPPRPILVFGAARGYFARCSVKEVTFQKRPRVKTFVSSFCRAVAPLSASVGIGPRYLSFLCTAGTSELVMLSLELVKTRLAVMSMEMRKNFIQTILTSLIEKSPDAKILRAVVKIVEEWVKNNSPMAANQVSCRVGFL